jgi:hypothetical protein
MAADKAHWMQAAFAGAKNQLRKSTKTKAGHNISDRSLTKAEHSRSPLTRKRAALARTARKIAARHSGR